MKLRPYQQDAITAIYDSFVRFPGQNQIVAMPTGTGKSPVIGEFIRHALMAYPGTRVMMLTHVKELIEQNHDKLLRIWPSAPVGIYSAGLDKRHTGFPVTYAGIASVSGRANQFGPIDLVLVDECHLISPKQDTMYQKFIWDLQKVCPHVRVIGFTATPYRLGMGMLTNGGLFDRISYDITGLGAFNKLIDDGYLIPLIPKRTNMQYDVSNVKHVGGEFVQSELQAVVDQNGLTYQAVKEIIELGHDRHHWLIFASGVEHAKNVTSMFDSFGIDACCIHSKQSDEINRANLEGFKSGKYRVAVNNNVLTTGFDFPGIDLIGILRPTDSPGLWVQMLGRGTRPVYSDGYDLETHEGRISAIKSSSKQNCLVLDFAGNTKRLGPINDPMVPRAKGQGGGGVAPVRECPQCGTYCHASVRTCPECSYEFPKTLEIAGTAFTDEIIRTSLPQIEIFKVDKLTYSVHKKLGRPDSLLATYYCGLRQFKEYVCLEHDSYAKHKAHEWWRERNPHTPPETVAEAMALINQVKTPSHLRVWINQKHPEIVGYDFTGTGFANV